MAGVTQTRDQEEPLVLDIIKHRAGNTAQTQCHEPAREGDGVPRTDPQEGGGRKRLKTNCGFRRRAARSVVSDSARPRGLQPARLLRPWGSPGKNTGVGCHFLLLIHVEYLSCLSLKSTSFFLKAEEYTCHKCMII